MDCLHWSFADSVGPAITGAGGDLLKSHTRVVVRLYITHFDCLPSEITRILGIRPTATWQRGSPMPGLRVSYKVNCWKLHSPLSSTAGPEEQIGAIFRKIRRAIAQFKDLPSDANVDFLVAVHAYDDSQRTMGVSEETIRALAKMNAVLSFEYYDYRVDEAGRPESKSTRLATAKEIEKIERKTGRDIHDIKKGLSTVPA